MADVLAISDSPLQEKRERVFLLLAGIFLSAMALLNVIGITRFIQIGPMQLAVGVLAYPLTFICTDLICELYGRDRANFLVTIGLVVNLFVLAIMTLANSLPAIPLAIQPPWQTINLAEPLNLPNGSLVMQSTELFSILYACTTGAMIASMLAYVVAQYVDVFLFHFFKKLTAGRHLWLRNNASTLSSQLVDSVMVISVTFGAAFYAGKMELNVLLGLIASSYMFKLVVALIDTPLIYLLVGKLRKYLQLEPPYA